MAVKPARRRSVTLFDDPVASVPLAIIVMAVFAMCNATTRPYTLAATLLHWVSAAVILWATVTGVYAAFFAGPATRAWLSWFNVSLTTLFVPIFSARIVVALTAAKPPLPSALSRRHRLAARLGHAMLYVVTGLVLASGMGMMQHDIAVFDCFSLPRPVHDVALNRRFATIHRIGSTMLAMLIAGHIGAVIVHQRAGFGLMRRMRIGGRPQSDRRLSRHSEPGPCRMTMSCIRADNCTMATTGAFCIICACTRRKNGQVFFATDR